MSKKCKAASKLKNLQAKRSRKAANRALYESRRDAGNNSKSRRSKRRGKRKLVNTMSHKDGACGNIACKRCDPAGIHGTINRLIHKAA